MTKLRFAILAGYVVGALQAIIFSGNRTVFGFVGCLIAAVIALHAIDALAAD